MPTRLVENLLIGCIGDDCVYPHLRVDQRIGGVDVSVKYKHDNNVTWKVDGYSMACHEVEEGRETEGDEQWH